MFARFVKTGQMAAIGLIAAAVFPAFAQDQASDRRAAQVPIVTVPLDGDVASDQGLRKSVLDILQQLDQLQLQVRQLRDSVEVQAHDLQVLQTRQRDLIADLDKRVSALEAQGSAAGAAPSAGAAVVAQAGLQATTPGQQKDYDAAFGLMKQGFYERAIKAFRAFIVKYPNAALADNAQYWIAEGNYVMGNYKLALEEFNKVLATYPNSTKAQDAMLKVGYVEYELGSYGKARKALNDVIAHYPNTTVAKLAATRLDKMQKEGH
ncbi:MAG: tol-pal system protein YbgF [Acidiferrobacterales bacterium]